MRAAYLLLACAMNAGLVSSRYSRPTSTSISSLVVLSTSELVTLNVPLMAPFFASKLTVRALSDCEPKRPYQHTMQLCAWGTKIHTFTSMGAFNPFSVTESKCTFLFRSANRCVVRETSAQNSLIWRGGPPSNTSGRITVVSNTTWSSFLS